MRSIQETIKSDDDGDLFFEIAEIQDYQDYALEHDLYAQFVDSQKWEDSIEEIRKLSEVAAEIISTHGIGDRVDSDGYNFESGELLADLSQDDQDFIKSDDDIYDAVCALARSYGHFVISFSED
jgi:hypothetical protein